MIRKFVKRDIDIISNLVFKFLSSNHEYDGQFGHESIVECLNHSLLEDNHLYVITNEEDNAIGYINFHILNFPLILGKELYISEIFVNEEERSKNLGTRLINFAINKAKELGCKRIMLNNSVESISYKRNFYKNLGFSQRDTMANFILKLVD